MTRYDLYREINCKYITSDNGGGDSVTWWLECKLHKKVTGKNTCAKCKDRIPKYNTRANEKGGSE